MTTWCESLSTANSVACVRLLLCRAGWACNLRLHASHGVAICLSVAGVVQAALDPLLFTALQIRKYDRRGAQLSALVTPLTDAVIFLEAMDERVWAATQHAVMCFRAASEESTWHATEAISSCTLLPMPDGHQLVLAGCQDRCVRLLDGGAVLQVSALAGTACTARSCVPEGAACDRELELSHLISVFVASTGIDDGRKDVCRLQHSAVSSHCYRIVCLAGTQRPQLRLVTVCCALLASKFLVQEVRTEAAPTALRHCALGHDVLNKHPTRQEVLFGLVNGNIGQLFFDSSTHHPGFFERAEPGSASVTQIYSAFDMTQSGLEEIAVSREDGTFTLYNVDSASELQLVREENPRVHAWSDTCS